LVSATHKDLAAEIEASRFRQDLYYRINVIDVSVPALRERLEDLPELTDTILRKIEGTDGPSEAKLDESALAALAQYNFPGNVRELENMLERALALSDGAFITVDDLQFASSAPAPKAPVASEPAEPVAPPATGEPRRSVRDAYGDLEGYLEDIEREIISTALEECRWNKTATAKLLGVSFRSLRYRLQKLDLVD